MKNTNNINIDQIIELISKARNPMFICHENPDGDTYGSAFALRQGLGRKDCSIACASSIEWPFTELNVKDTLADINGQDNDIYVFLDCGSLNMAGDAIAESLKKGIPILNIDHHQSNYYYADYNYVIERSSTCEIVFDILMTYKDKLCRETADYLYMGIAGDTGLFVHGYTSPETHYTAGKLIEFGAEFDRISKLLFRTVSRETAFLKGKLYNNLEIIDNQFAFSYISLKDFEDCNAELKDSLGLMSDLTEIADMKICILLKQVGENTYKSSLRSTKEYDISRLAVANGGGGHKQAAGCKFTGRIEDIKKQIFNQINELGIL